MRSQAIPGSSVKDFCSRFNISRQAHYQQLKHEKEVAEVQKKLRKKCEEIRASHAKMSGRKLYVKMGDWLTENGIKIGRDALYKALENFGLQLRRKKGRKRTTNSDHPFRKYPDLAKHFEPTGVEQLQVSDLTYIRLEIGFCYLSLITDAWSKYIAGWKVAGSMEACHTLDALHMSLNNKKLKERKTIHHSDRGVQYCSYAYTDLLKENDFQISMTQSSEPTDNAIAERINGILKDEYGLDRTFKSVEEVEKRVREVVRLYNEERPHLSLGMLTPTQAHKKPDGTQFNKLWKNRSRPDRARKAFSGSRADTK